MLMIIKILFCIFWIWFWFVTGHTHASNLAWNCQPNRFCHIHVSGAQVMRTASATISFKWVQPCSWNEEPEIFIPNCATWDKKQTWAFSLCDSKQWWWVNVICISHQFVCYWVFKTMHKKLWFTCFCTSNLSEFLHFHLIDAVSEWVTEGVVCEKFLLPIHFHTA